MIAVLKKLADQIDLGDVQALIAENVPESAQIEFKESLPAKGSGDPDPWMQGNGRIGDRARNAILEEVVAFANAYGGALVLGIAENGAKPPVAVDVAPLPRCADLAERFRLMFRDCVEPQLPMLDIVPIPTNDDQGLIVFRTDRSRLGPHRVAPKLTCPIRRADRCEHLSMREIQDMILNLARNTERLERRLRKRSRKFADDFKRLETPDDAFGFRMTAVPVGNEIRLESVYANGNLIDEFRLPRVEVQRQSDSGNSQLRTIENPYQIHFHDWRPMLGAARAEQSRGPNRRVVRYSYAEIHADGMLELGFVWQHVFRNPYDSERLREVRLDSELPISTLGQLFVWADHVRLRASSPGAEYAIQPQFRVTADSVDVGGNDDRVPVGSIERKDTAFPLYPLAATGEIEKIVSRFERDFWHYFGKDPGWRSRKPLVITQA